MITSETALFTVTDITMVAEARRAVVAWTAKAGLAEPAQGRVALVVTEMATNVARHGGGGSILLRSLISGRRHAVDIVAVDRGPGMADVGKCLRDGYSTGGTRGEGLGAIARKADLFDIWSQPGQGVALLARIGDVAAEQPFESLAIGAVNVPFDHLPVSGDAWAVHDQVDATTLCVADGLGHGPDAHDAAQEAMRVFRQHPGAFPEEVLKAQHEAMITTRGAAVSICRVPRDGGAVRYASIGNIAGAIVTQEVRRGMLCHNGIIGHQVSLIAGNDYPHPDGSLIVIHSDGLTTNWNFSDYPGLALRHPAIIAAVLWRDHSRGRDDTCVLVVRGGT
jgi:anti-sigma regulatory factor (Ser/Thr protein kinase)